jgi:hypothetical protein
MYVHQIGQLLWVSLAEADGSGKLNLLMPYYLRPASSVIECGLDLYQTTIHVWLAYFHFSATNL